MFSSTAEADSLVGAKAAAVAAILLFTASAVIGLLVGHAPGGDVGLSTSEELQSYVESDAFWNRDEAEAKRVVALANIERIHSLKEANMTIAQMLQVATFVQFLGVAALATAIASGLFTA